MARRKRAKDPEHEQQYHDLPPAWPPYVPKPKERLMAVMLGDGSILDENGKTYTPETYEEMAQLLFARNLQVFIGDVSHACEPWQNEIRDELVGEAAGKLRGGWSETPWNANNQYLTGVRVHRKWPDSRGRMRWQVREMTVSTTWARAIEPALLTDLRFVFDLLEIGVCATPGRAGYMTMAQFWKGKNYREMPRHFRPPLSLVEALEKHAIGSRRETYRPTEWFETAYELDRRCGFAAESGELPCGPVIWFPPCVAHDLLYHVEEEPRQATFTWWGKCLVKIVRDLPMGDVAPFAVRDEKTEELEWPTKAGSYTTYLWKHEADEIQNRFVADGSLVVLTILEAWGWMESTTQLAAWRSWMDAERREAEGYSKAAADLVKAIIVAGIGRFGLPYEHSEIRAEPWDEHSLPLEGAGLFDEPVYLKTEFEDVGTPAHWHKWILSKMNMKLYEVLRWGYLNSVGTVACNVDGVIFETDPGWGVDPAVAAIGDFKRQDLGYYTACPYDGGLISPKKTTLPGIERKYRERLFRIGEYKPEAERRRSHKQAPRDAFSGEMKVRFMALKEKLGPEEWDTLVQLEEFRQTILKMGDGSG